MLVTVTFRRVMAPDEDPSAGVVGPVAGNSRIDNDGGTSIVNAAARRCPVSRDLAVADVQGRSGGVGHGPTVSGIPASKNEPAVPDCDMVQIECSVVGNAATRVRSIQCDTGDVDGTAGGHGKHTLTSRSGDRQVSGIRSDDGDIVGQLRQRSRKSHAADSGIKANHGRIGCRIGGGDRLSQRHLWTDNKGGWCQCDRHGRSHKVVHRIRIRVAAGEIQAGRSGLVERLEANLSQDNRQSGSGCGPG